MQGKHPAKVPPGAVGGESGNPTRRGGSPRVAWMRPVGDRHRRARRGPGLGGEVRPAARKIPDVCREADAPFTSRKKKKKFSGKLLTFCIYEYIFVYTTICGNVAA